MPFAVVHIGTRDGDVIALDEDRFDAVLDVFDFDDAILNLLVEVGGDANGQKLKDIISHFLMLLGESPAHGILDLFKIEIDNGIVSLLDSDHSVVPLFFS